MPVHPDLLPTLLLGCAASLAVAGLAMLVLTVLRRGWPALLAGGIAGLGLWATLGEGAPALPVLAMTLFPATLALAGFELSQTGQAARQARLGMAALAAILAVLGLAAGSLLPLEGGAVHAAGAGAVIAGLAALALLPAAAPAALLLCLAGVLPGLAVLLPLVADLPELLAPAAAALSLWLLLLVLLLVRSLDLQALEARIWEQAAAEVGEEADRRVAQALAEEVAERGRLEDRLIRATTVDAVSGTATRSHFLSTARALYRQRRESGAAPCAIAVVAIDELREINAYYGFKGGDATLAAIGRSVRDLGSGDVPACRWSGRRFCVWLMPKRGQSPVLLAERLRGTLSSTQVPLPEGRFQVTVSVGVAEDRDGQGLDRVIAAAEAALQEAEAAGGNRVASA